MTEATDSSLEISNLVFESFPAHVAVLDETGVIIKVNEAWRKFGDENGLNCKRYLLGQNYLSLCTRAAEDHEEGNVAQAVLESVQAVLSDTAARHTHEYPCHSETQQRWFRLQISAFEHDRKKFITMVHANITSLKLTEVLLSQVTDRYGLAIDGSTDGIWDWMHVLRDEQWWSPRFYELLGYPDNGIKASFANIKELLHPEDLENTLAAMQAHFDDPDTSFDVNYRLKNREGHYRWFRARGIVSRDDTGQPIRMTGSLQDIHELISAEQRLRESEQVFQSLYYNAPDMYLTVDASSGKIQKCNLAFSNNTGFSPKEVVGKPVLEVFTESYRDEAAEIYSELSTIEHVESRDTKVERQGAEPLDVSMSLEIVRDDYGQAKYTLTSFRDITERKQHAQRLQLALEASPSGMVMVDEQGFIRLVNTELELIFGYDRSELLGQKIERLMPEQFRQEHPYLRDAYFQNPSARRMGQGRDLHGLCKDGSEIPVEVALSPVITADDRYVLAAIVDISERKKAEAAIERKNEDLETLLYITSHDLREPLRAIQNFSRMVNERYRENVDEKGQHLLQRIKEGADRMDALVEDILELSRAKRMKAPTEDLNLTDIVKYVLESLNARIEETSASIRVASTFATIVGNQRWVTQAVFNLVANALKFGGDNPPNIEVDHYVCSEGNAGIAVRDRGIGITEEHASSIFVLFRRAVGRSIEGTGAGLAIVKQVAENHGGKAWAQPREGGGSEFFVTFGSAQQS